VNTRATQRLHLGDWPEQPGHMQINESPVRFE
jgi:hypothetical protein